MRTLTESEELGRSDVGRHLTGARYCSVVTEPCARASETRAF